MELAVDRVTGETPRHWLYVLHGIFGSGRNWASVMRRLTRARPEWAALLIDLRQHGASQGFEPPHTVRAAAEDLHGIAASGGPAPAAILGHSFGGKVALAFAEDPPASLRQAWIIDSTPEARVPDGSAWGMLQVVRGLPDRFESRDVLIDALTERGVARPVAQWMATNLEPAEGGYRWRFDLDGIQDLLEDFFETDLWNVVEHPPGDVEVHLVKAEESSVLSGAALARAEAIGGRTRVHRIAGGHWVNADSPEALLDLLERYLPR